MASENNDRSWFGKLCYQLDALETDDLLIEEPMKYLSEKLTIAGDSFLKFCSDVVDCIPQSIFNPDEQTLEEGTTSLPVNETSNDVEINHEEILANSSTDQFLAKECVAQVENSEQLVNENGQDGAHSDFSISDHSSETTEKVTDITTGDDYNSPVDKTTPIVEEFVSNNVHEDDSSSDKFPEKDISHSCVAQVVNNSEENVNGDELDEAHAKFSVSDHSSPERVEKAGDNITLEEIIGKCELPDKTIILSTSTQSTEASRSRDSNPTNYELNWAKAIEVQQYVRNILAMQKIEENFFAVEADKSHSDSDQEEKFQFINKKKLKIHSSKCIDAELDEEESETYEEGFSDSDCEWEFI